MSSVLINQAGNHWFQQGRYAEALDHYRRALEMDRRTGNSRDLATTLGNLANVYAGMGDPEKALDYYREVLALHRRLGDRRVIGITLVNMGNLHADRREWATAKAHYLEAADLLEAYPDPRGLGNLYGNMAWVVREEGDWERAATLYEKGIRELRRAGNNPELARNLIGLGKTRLLQGRPEEALKQASEALTVSRELGDDLGCAAAWYSLAAASESLGRFGKAAEWMALVLEVDERYGLPKLAENRRRLDQLNRRKEE